MLLRLRSPACRPSLLDKLPHAPPLSSTVKRARRLLLVPSLSLRLVLLPGASLARHVLWHKLGPPLGLPAVPLRSPQLLPVLGVLVLPTRRPTLIPAARVLVLLSSLLTFVRPLLLCLVLPQLSLSLRALFAPPLSLIATWVQSLPLLGLWH
jgi:hypothetical protein